MKPKSLMKRSAFASRRKVLLYVLTAILAVSIVGAWGVSDGIPTVPVAGERIVMWQELPDRGTPEDYDLLTNLKFASQKIYTASYFRSETNGTVVGKSAGIPITQTVRNTRVKKRDPERGDIVFSEAISTSSLVDSYEQQYSEGDIVFTRQRASGSGDNTVWEDNATHLSLAAYSERYGTIPNELSKYVIGYTADMLDPNKTVFTVLSARDENAREKAAANAAAEDGGSKINGEDGAVTPIDVPQTLVADENGHYTFTVELDPLNSTKYYRNEVKTRAGKSASYPSFISASITFTIDSEWNPVSVTTNEKYDISIGISATCTSSLTEVFYQINDPDGKVPEEDFFAPRVEDVRNSLSNGGTSGDNGDDDKVPDSPVEYLAVAFADYFGGVKPLTLSADITAGDFTAESVKLSVNFGTMNIRVKLGALYAEYIDDKVYITLNDIKGYVPKDKFTELLGSGALGGIAGALPDFSALMGDGAISTLFANCEMTSTDGITRIRLPFEIDGIKADASLYMNDKDLSLNSITGDIDAFGTDINIRVKPISKLPNFPASYNGYADLSGMLDFIPDAIATATGTTYGASGTVTVNGTTVGVDAYIDRTDGDGVKLDADITALGQKINLKFVNDELFASIGNIKVRGTAQELPALIDAVCAVTGMDLDALDSILPTLKTLIPTNADSIVGMLKRISVSDDELSLGLGYMGIPLDLTLRRGDGRLTGIAFDVAVDMFGIKASAAADLDISAPAARAVTPDDGEYITFSQLAEILTDVAPYITADAYSARLDGTLDTGSKTAFTIDARINRIKSENGETVQVAADVSALGQTLSLVYIDDTAYMTVGSLRFKLTPDKTTLDELKPILDAAGIKLDVPELAKLLPAALAAIKSLTVNADGALVAEIAAGGITASATLNAGTGTIAATVNAANISLALSGTVLPATPEQISTPDGEFTDAAQLVPTVSAAMPIINEKALTAKIDLGVSGNVYPATVELSFVSGLKAKITESTFGAQITVIGKTAYIEIGEIRVVGTTDDIPALIDALRPVLPQNVLAPIESMLGMLGGKTDIQNIVAQALSAIKSFTVIDGNAEILLALGETATATVTLATDLSSADIKASAGSANIAVCMNNITAGCNAITSPDGDFVAASELMPTVSAAMPIINEKALTAKIDLGVNGNIYPATVELSFVSGLKAKITESTFGAQITVIGKTAYVELGEIRVVGTTDDIPALIDELRPALPQNVLAPIESMLGMLGGNADIQNIVAQGLSAIKSFTVYDGNAEILLALGETTTATITLATDLSSADIKASAGSANITVGMNNIAAGCNAITSPDGNFVAASELMPTVSAAMPIINAKALTAQLDLGVSGNVYPATVELSFADGLKAKITESTFGAQITVIGKTAYIEIGEIRVVGTTDDVPALIDALRPVIPQNVITPIESMLGMLGGGKADIQNIVTQALSAIKSFTVNDGNAEILLALGETATATVTLATDLSTADIKVSASGANITVGMNNIAAGCNAITSPDGDFAAARKIIAVAAPVLPLATKEKLAFSLGGNVLGVPVTNGGIYFDGAAKAFSLDVTLADLNAAVSYIGGTVYADVNGGASPIKLACGTSPAELKDLLHKLDYALRGIEKKVYELLEMFKNVTVEQILGMLALSSADGGFKVTLDTRDIGFDSVTELTLARMPDGLDIAVDCSMAMSATKRLDISAHLFAGVSGSEVVSISADDAVVTISSNKDGSLTQDIITLFSSDAPLTLTAEDRTCTVSVSGKYVPVSLVSEYIAPIVDIIETAKSVKTITLGLDAFALISEKYTQIGGEVTIALDEASDKDGNTVTTLGGVHASLKLFKNTSAEEAIDITLVNDTLYIETGKIALKLDISDSANSDLLRIYNVLAEYLPQYLCDELAKLLGLMDGASMFSDISLIIERMTDIAAAQSVDATIGLLFAPLNNLAGDSAVKTLLNMISLSAATTDAGATELVASLTAMGITANVTPHLSNGKISTLGLTAGMQSLGLSLGADVVFKLSPEKKSVSTAAEAANFVSIAEFVEAINNGIHTFMTKDEDGNITFEVTTFDFDYVTYETEKLLDENKKPVQDENGNEITVKDEAGRAKPAIDENGNKVIADTIKVKNKPGESALKGKFETVYETDEDGNRVTDESGEYIIKDVRFSLEAHISLEIGSLAYSPLALDLYVLKTNEYPDGIACIYYTEQSGHGERISIDYTSVMQLLAAVMDIVGAKDETVEYLLGEYRLPIDTDVFDSMAIAGFDSIKDMLDGLAQAVMNIKDALANAENAIDLINTAGSVDNLRARLDDVTETEIIDGVETTVVKQRGIKSYLADAIQNIKDALAAFGSGNTEDEDTDEDAPTETPVGTYAVINGELYKNIVNGVRFVKTENAIGAVIYNSITTNTVGEATVTVTQSNGTVDSITVGGLDVNTAKLNNFDMRFTAGKNVNISLPADYATPTDSKVTYSNLADIKHLLFDVMNTANMLEFDIGGLDTSDAIDINMSLGADWLASLKLKVKYDAKVKIIKVGENSAGKPIYKTAAAVEIHNEKTTAKILNIGVKTIVPDCTTRLFFYDDVLYIQGVRDWQNTTRDRVVGTVNDNIVCEAIASFGRKETRYPTLKNSEYLCETTGNIDYVEVMYTVDELLWMMKNDIAKFLDEFLFYLIPLTTEKIAGQDIRGLISSSISGSSSGEKDTSNKTPAQIFKGYTYNNGKHSLTLGLAELASSSSLGDLNISLTGANDGDENILDNYISSLNVNTKIAGIISVNMDATLRNVALTPDGKEIYSKGLSPTNVTVEGGYYSLDGIQYQLECRNYDRNAIYTLDGLTYLTADGNGLYSENGTFAPALRATTDADQKSWTSTVAETRYCDSVYKVGDLYATYYYSASLGGYGYIREGDRDTYYIGTNADGSKYVYRTENGTQIRVAVKSITESLLAQVTRDGKGKIASVTNRVGGAQWARPWKAAYDAAQATQAA